MNPRVICGGYFIRLCLCFSNRGIIVSSFLSSGKELKMPLKTKITIVFLVLVVVGLLGWGFVFFRPPSASAQEDIIGDPGREYAPIFLPNVLNSASSEVELLSAQCDQDPF